jgi:hypothetical protein
VTSQGTLAVGSDADIVVFDPNGSTTILMEGSPSKVDYSIYEGRVCAGAVRHVFSRGHQVIADGAVVGRAGHGRFLAGLDARAFLRLVRAERPPLEFYSATMLAAGSRGRDLPAPPRIVFEALTQPDRDPARPWLSLLEDEIAPVVIDAVANTRVVWSSMWPSRPDAQVHFDLATGSGTYLRWTLWVDEPVPDASKLGHLRKRLNLLINANLRYTFGQ